ncbi:MAG: hypothetical protein ABIP79_15590 [Chitinophagaceae bacterium]
MKKIFFFILTATFLFSCKSKDAEQQSSDEDSINAPFYWQAYFDDSTGKVDYRKIPSNDSLSTTSIIDFLNAGNTNIKLEFVKTSNDTVFLRIADAIHLTQQMGSTGPTIYLSEVVYNMTQMPGIKEVNIDFEEGDHATPGTYNRTTFDKE